MAIFSIACIFVYTITCGIVAVVILLLGIVYTHMRIHGRCFHVTPIRKENKGIVGILFFMSKKMNMYRSVSDCFHSGIFRTHCILY